MRRSPAVRDAPRPTPAAARSNGRAPADRGTARKHARARKGAGAALTLGALGVVFGDIGTSPLYAVQTVFSIDHGAVHPSAGAVYGVMSLIFWSITLIVSIKYLT